MLLPDINVWLALTFDSHAHHPAAKEWFDGLSGQVCFFCRVTKIGFLRLTTNPRVFGSHALTLPEAWEKYDIFQSDSFVSFFDEPADLEVHWRNYTKQPTYSPNVWNDAYLAALSVAANLELVTFDQGFSRYPAARFKILT